MGEYQILSLFFQILEQFELLDLEYMWPTLTNLLRINSRTKNFGLIDDNQIAFY